MGGFRRPSVRSARFFFWGGAACQADERHLEKPPRQKRGRGDAEKQEDTRMRKPSKKRQMGDYVSETVPSYVLKKDYQSRKRERLCARPRIPPSPMTWKFTI